MITAQIRQFFVKDGLKDQILVAVSGGADSTALLAALHELGADLVAGHVNHHLRGADSDADEAFVRELCARLTVPLQVADGTLDPELVRERGIEAAAREVRYAALTRMREECGARWIATAHQKNDQAETILMRLLTGSGVAGLRGIHARRDDGLIRPLLDVSRDAIEAYLSERGLVPRRDLSNDDPRFLRNRVRAFLREVDATEPLLRVAEQARAQWPLLERAIDEADRAYASTAENETRFSHWPEDEWLRGALLQRHIRRLDPGARDFDAARIAGELATLTRSSVTRNLELLRKGESFVLRRRTEPVADFEVSLRLNESAFLAPIGTTIHVSERGAQEGGGSLDFARDDSGGARDDAWRQPIQLPEAATHFTVRNRRPGDRFHPLGSAGPKKLKEFLIDRKIDADVRDRLPLLVWNGEIVWIAGVEVSERFKVTGTGGVLYEVWTDERDQARLQR